MAAHHSRSNSTANWLAVVAALLLTFLLFLVYLAILMAENGIFG
jgi:hypothetical protein